MDEFDFECMQGSIKIANAHQNEYLGVGVVVRLEDNRLITSFASLKNKSAWLTNVKYKLSLAGASHVSGIYLTINTISEDGGFDLSRLLETVSADKIYVGMPDPELCCYKIDDPVIRLKNIFRYPDSLQKLILEQNSTCFGKSRQNIKFSPYYSDVRISKLVQDILAGNGIDITKQELVRNKNVDKLVGYLVGTKGINLKKASDIVNRALSEAFNEKYAAYDYRKDARFLSLDWASDFEKVIEDYLPNGLKQLNVLNVGVGSGEEALKLFADCKNISFVDVAAGGLKKIKKVMPWVKTFKTRAENLADIEGDLFDAYVSLRTYNSSFFDISQALFEARRVLKKNGVFIISIANGFLCSNNYILPGLIIPGCEFVDIYRGLEVAGNLRGECEKLGFDNVKIYPTTTEIYLAGKLSKKRKRY